MKTQAPYYSRQRERVLSRWKAMGIRLGAHENAGSVLPKAA